MLDNHQQHDGQDGANLFTECPCCGAGRHKFNACIVGAQYFHHCITCGAAWNRTEPYDGELDGPRIVPPTADDGAHDFIPDPIDFQPHDFVDRQIVR
jgi:hypothetical protein